MWKKGSRCRDSKGIEIKSGKKTFRKDRVRQRLEGEETEEWGGGGGRWLEERRGFMTGRFV